MTQHAISPHGEADRCKHQRTCYERSWGIEEFRVPSLNAEINRALDMATKLLGGGTGSCLDVGCGRQPLRSKLEQLGYHYESCDVIQNLDGTVDHIFPLDAPLPAAIPHERYSLLICTEVLEHVLGWQQAFSNLDTLLRPGGVIVITTPFVYPLHEEPYDFYRPTRYAISQMCEQRRWHLVYENDHDDAWDVLGTVLQCLGTAEGSRGLLAMSARYAWRAFKFVGLTAARSKFVRGAIRLTGNLPMGTVIVAQKTIADAGALQGHTRAQG